MECEDSSDEESSQTDGNTEQTSSEDQSEGVNQLSNGTTDTDTEEDVMEKEETSKEETAVTGVSSFSQAGEPESKSKKVCRIILLSNGLLACQIKW